MIDHLAEARRITEGETAYDATALSYGILHALIAIAERMGEPAHAPVLTRDDLGRCLSDITHRDEEHRQSVCMLPVGHAPLAHDDCLGYTWTDADRWEPSVIDRVADELARIADESQHEGWDSPCVRSIVGRIQRALDGDADA